METRRLEYFVVLTAEGNFSRAASRLNITQSALSQQIQRLERDIGSRLIDRSVVPFELTVVGTRLLAHSRTLLEGVDRIGALATDARHGRVGRVRMGLAPSMLYSDVPAMIRRFSTEYEQVETPVVRESAPTLIEQLRLNQLDVVFPYTRPPTSAGLSYTELHRGPYVAVLPDDHDLAGESDVDLGQLRDETIMLSPRFAAPEAQDAILAACLERGFSAHRITVEGSTYTDQIGLVAAGLGVALLPSHLANISLRGICYVPVSAPPIRSRIMMVWNPSMLAASRDRFLLFARQHFAAREG